MVDNEVIFRGVLSGSGYSSCPDIMVMGQTEIDPSIMQSTFITNWSTDPSVEFTYSVPNHIYIRGQGNVTTTNVNIRLYYVKYDLTSGYQTTALSQQLSTTQGLDYVKINVTNGVQFYVGTPFVINVSAPAGGSKYSFIVTGTTDSTDTTWPSSPVATETAFITYISGNGVENMGLKSALLGWDGGSMYYGTATVSYSDIGKPLPELVYYADGAYGYDVAMEVTNNDSNGNRVFLPRTTVPRNDYMQFALPMNITSGWTSNVDYFFYENGFPYGGGTFLAVALGDGPLGPSPSPRRTTKRANGMMIRAVKFRSVFSTPEHEPNSPNIILTGKDLIEDPPIDNDPYKLSPEDFHSKYNKPAILGMDNFIYVSAIIGHSVQLSFIRVYCAPADQKEDIKAWRTLCTKSGKDYALLENPKVGVIFVPDAFVWSIPKDAQGEMCFIVSAALDGTDEKMNILLQKAKFTRWSQTNGSVVMSTIRIF